MPTFPKLQRNITYKIYLKNFITISVIVLLNSSFIYVPLFIGLFITLNLRLSFILPFLFFTEIAHSFIYSSLILFYFIFKKYIYSFFNSILFNITDYLAIVSIYILYFSFLYAYNIMNNSVISFNFTYILYYILIEELLLFIYKKILS